MSKVKIELLKSGIEELMKSEEIQEVLQSEANEVVGRCAGSYDVDIFVGKTRANSSIITRDSATYHKNLKDNELLKALGAGK